ncbi:MAG: hypothetical protein DRH37_09240 [Deltaproteobacteria bacterium]|nr:MAG: hypothetical protein DRH37_09240 [Deltaproteobacteria bacterium]
MPEGTSVTFTTTLGKFPGGNIFKSFTSRLTLSTADDEGVVITSLVSEGTGGPAEITATSGGVEQTIYVIIDDGSVDVGEIILTSADASIPADGSSSTAITVLIKNSSGQPVPSGTPVVLNILDTGDPAFDPSFGTGGETSISLFTIGTSGTATTPLIASNSSGIATIIATAGSKTQSVTVLMGAGTPSGLVLTATALIVNPGEKSTITATLTDDDGNPIEGETIAFVLDPNNSNAILSAPSAETNINGQATITYTAGVNNGDDIVTARLNTNPGTNDSVEIVVGGQVSLTASPTTITANGTDTSTFTATVKNNAGTPVENVLVVFKDITGADLTEVQAGTFNGTGPGDTPLFTHGGGAMTFTISVTDDGYYSIWLYDKANNLVDMITSATGNITDREVIKQVPAGEYYLKIEWTDGPWKIDVVSELGGEIAGALDDFDKLPTMAIQNTNAAGQATYVYTSTTTAKTVMIGIKAGKALADASIDQVAGPVDSLELYAAPDTVNPLSESTLTAVVKDANGNPVFGETVSFAFGTNNSGGRLAAATAVTTLSGEASVTYRAGGRDLVTDTLRATIASPALSAATTIDVDASAVMIGSVTIERGSATLPADGSSQTFIRATVRDMDGQPVSGIAVEYTVSMSGASITTPVNTNDDGIAQTMLTSSIHSGICTVTAIAGGFRRNIDVEFLPGVPRRLSLNAAPSTVHPSGTSTVTALLADRYGNPVAGETITFVLTADNSGASLSAPSAVTNINGQAMITYTAGSSSRRVVDIIRATSVTDT